MKDEKEVKLLKNPVVKPIKEGGELFSLSCKIDRFPAQGGRRFFK